MRGWSGRLEELASWPVDLPWQDVWVLLMRGEHETGRDWAQRQLWSIRLWTWVEALSKDPRTCQVCGGRIEGGPQAAHCSTACRKLAHRRRKDGRPTPFGEVVATGRRRLADARRQIGYARRWLRRVRRNHPKMVLLPPNLATFDHLPGLPSPCSGGCGPGAPCDYTDGGLCILAGSSLSNEDEESPEGAGGKR